MDIGEMRKFTKYQDPNVRKVKNLTAKTGLIKSIPQNQTVIYAYMLCSLHHTEFNR